MNKITWEEIIIKIRKEPAYRELVELAYFEEDLALNVERFRSSEEFEETLKMLRTYTKDISAQKLLDLGAGNGVASAAFALEGYDVTAVEPDPSATIGAGAIRQLVDIYKLKNLQVIEAWGESLPCASQSFDVVYIRQAVHHAAELNNFIRESARLLKPGGVLMSARDHVIYNEMDKQWFLETHPLHRFYGGENAFTEQEYRLAIEGAGLDIVLCLHHYESVINYFPEKRDEVEGKLYERKKWIELAFLKKAPPPLNKISFLINLCYARIEKKLTPVFDERKIPGRMISFIAIKNA